ncbi:MAG: SGNH/GDSL hydrolase family protein [Saprospiraceae bacterium]|nr:SGNH/GDSL hydrolase family protein [Saprospiraceae bacterium]
MKNPIRVEELIALLSNEVTKAQTLKDYFIFVQTSPFEGDYQLRVEISLILPGSSLSDEKEGFVGSSFKMELMAKANNDSREKRAKRYEEIKNDRNRIRIVTEGDSWFQYPKFSVIGLSLTKDVKDIIDQLIEDNKFAIKSLDAGGDIIRNMYHGREYIKELADQNPKILLLSAGGNDFFEVFPKMLKKNDEPTKIEGWLNPNYITELQVLSKYYDALLTEVVSKHPDVKIIIHGYDYIMPKSDGKWIGKPMVEVGISGADDRKKLIRFIMDEFNNYLMILANKPELQTNVYYLNLRGTVPQDKNYWHDEIHPNDRGFKLIADKYKVLIDSLIS